MAQYELIFIVQPGLEEEPLKALVDKVSQTIQDLGGQDVQIQPWGRRRLAYSIQRHREGFYFLVNMDLPKSAVRTLERSLQLMEDVLRYLVVRKEEEAVKEG